MPDPAPDLLQGNGRASKPRSVPPEFELILEACRTPEERETMTRVLLMEFEGDPNSVMVQQAVMISRLIIQLQKVSLGPANGNGASPGHLKSPQLEAITRKIDSLEQLILTVQANENAAREKQNEHFAKECSATRTAGEEYRHLRIKSLWAFLAVAAALGALVSSVATYFILHSLWLIR